MIIVWGWIEKSGHKQLFPGDALHERVQNWGNIWKKIGIKKEYPGKMNVINYWTDRGKKPHKKNNLLKSEERTDGFVASGLDSDVLLCCFKRLK